MRVDTNLIEVISTDLRDMLGEDFDPDTFWDSLDGETDALDVLDRLIASDAEARSLAVAVKAQKDALAIREDRIKARSTAMRAQMLRVLDAAGERKVERPGGTISRRTGAVSVQITDESSIPSQLTKTTTTPDKAEIARQLKAGEIVPGAELVRGPDSISVRVA